MAILRDIKSSMQKKEPTKAVATAEAVQMIRDALPDKPVSDITSTDLANAVAFYMGQTTDHVVSSNFHAIIFCSLFDCYSFFYCFK